MGWRQLRFPSTQRSRRLTTAWTSSSQAPTLGSYTLRCAACCSRGSGPDCSERRRCDPESRRDPEPLAFQICKIHKVCLRTTNVQGTWTCAMISDPSGNSLFERCLTTSRLEREEEMCQLSQVRRWWTPAMKLRQGLLAAHGEHLELLKHLCCRPPCNFYTGLLNKRLQWYS